MKIGQRVRLKPEYRSYFSRAKSLRGVVVRISTYRDGEPLWRILRDGTKTAGNWSAKMWEHETWRRIRAPKVRATLGRAAAAGEKER